MHHVRYFKKYFPNILKAFIFLFFIFSAHTVSAAELSLVPASGTMSVGDTVRVRMMLSSNDTSANAISATLSFSKDILTLTSISKSDSLISLWPVEPSYLNVDGSINMEGVILSGYKGSNGMILTFFFKAKAIGSANIKFNTASVLANDGVGSNILTGTRESHFDVTAPKEKTTVPTVGAPIQTVPVNTTNPSTPIASTITTPIFIDYSKNVRSGEFLVVKGRADPDVTIAITSDGFTRGTDEPIHESTTVKTNDQGLFAYVSGTRVEKGRSYIVTAKAYNAQGIESNTTLPIKISVSDDLSIITICSFIFGMLLLIILYLLYKGHHHKPLEALPLLPHS